ncbi:MAG TPA: tRNA (adenosine(37)-N6)-threonylcarbamoyltransferase complex ATPase subunit type 1 TsaE [Candidatus Moranbacteria bacterium]|nr:tRNA (adenosine(37)-N6)-threonylcarbamoyltransferase complex ATPase subunit type 1 TsaE [Candidatus Moranbacteria bacterium]
MKKIITKNANETKELGRSISKDFQGGEIVCLEGDLGAGKTTFSQGILQGLGAEGPYTSPTFIVMKEYRIENNQIKNGKQGVKKIYHLDTYRVETSDILDLGWNELVANKNNVIIIEWSEKIKEIIPDNSFWVKFKHLPNNRREIIFS